jgi:cytoskeletal protein RodZ
MSAGDQDNGQAAGQIGQILEKKRLEKGLSLKEVEHATKIRTRYLEGLEREDPTALPDHVYARGFLKTYANFLGLDGERLSKELKDRRVPRRERQLDYQAYQAPTRASAREQPLITPGGVERRRVSGGTIITVTLAVLVLAGVIGALYYVGSRSSGSGGTADNSAEEPAEQEERDPTPPREEPVSDTTTGTAEFSGAGETEEKSSTDDAEEKAAVSETAPVTVRVFSSPTGMTVLADGAVVYDGVAQPGFSQTFEARRDLTVSTRNGGAVEVEVDGQNLGRIGQPGQPVTRDFPVQSAS